MAGAIVISPLAGEPQLFDPAVVGQFAEEMASLASKSQTPPWCGYIGRRDGEPVGFGGFKSAPDEEGTVEIGYLTFPNHEGTGVATAVTAEMIAIASQEEVASVIAHTLPEENASVRVLQKNGFVRDGEAEDPDEGIVWRWRLAL